MSDLPDPSGLEAVSEASRFRLCVQHMRIMAISSSTRMPITEPPMIAPRPSSLRRKSWNNNVMTTLETKIHTALKSKSDTEII